jgi:hypothetical protein
MIFKYRARSSASVPEVRDASDGKALGFNPVRLDHEKRSPSFLRELDKPIAQNRYAGGSEEESPIRLISSEFGLITCTSKKCQQ